MEVRCQVFSCKAPTAPFLTRHRVVVDKMDHFPGCTDAEGFSYLCDEHGQEFDDWRANPDIGFQYAYKWTRTRYAGREEMCQV